MDAIRLKLELGRIVLQGINYFEQLRHGQGVINLGANLARFQYAPVLERDEVLRGDGLGQIEGLVNVGYRHLVVLAFGFTQQVDDGQTLGMRKNLEHGCGTVQLLRFYARMQWFHESNKK